MPFSPDKENDHSAWFRSRKALNNVLFAMRLPPKNHPETAPYSPPLTTKIHDFTLTDAFSDKTSLLSDEILLKILANLSKSQRNANFLVSKRWLNLQGRLVRSIKILDWDFLVSGRMFLRFPNLIHVDLVNACLILPQNTGVVISNSISHRYSFFPENYVLNPNEVDRGLGVLASGYPNLKKLMVANATELGLLGVSEDCPALQELELHMCNDHVLRGIAAFQNLEVLRLYGPLVSDIGLIILAQGCKRLMKLELSGCRGSYEGIRAVGQCCHLLEELTFSDHEMEDGWLLALPYCENLKSLRFVSCRRIDCGGSDDEDLGCCSGVGSLYMDKCQLRDKKSLRALFLVCRNAKKISLRNCWGLTDDMFSATNVFRRVRSLTLEGCSLLTAHGLESVIIRWKEFKSLAVKSCNNIKDEGEVNPSVVFAALKKLKWEPYTKARLSANLAGTGIGKTGSRFFNRSSCDWKSSLPASYRTPLQQILESHT